MRFVYFASVREAIGYDGEELALPDAITTIGECLDWLGGQSAGHAAAIANRAKLRFALDQQMARDDDTICGAQELAIFPPVTGG